MMPAIFVCLLLMQSITPEVIGHAQAGAAALKQGRLDTAITEFRQVTELSPNSASGHANLGEAYFQKGDYGEAISELNSALQINPNLMGAHQTLGVALLLQGDAEQALPHLEKTRTPELLGLAYLETGRLGLAITALQAGLDRQPDDPDLLYYFGRAAALASKRTADQLAKVNSVPEGKAPAAADDSRAPQGVVSLQKALATRPNDPALLSAFSRAAALASTGAFERVLQTGAASARAHQILAERNAESGRLAEAEREYAESLKLKPYSPDVRVAYGDVLDREGKWTAAVAQFRMETELRPASPDAFYRLGVVLLDHGQPAGALEEFAHADVLRPDTPQILLALGQAASAANDAARAESSLKKLLGVDNESDYAASAHLGLAELYRRAGRSQEADREMTSYEKSKSKTGH